ncbi:hypothetical protein BDF22DRAFT_698310 [Syncephalis plumigaleata]|nr:hypothetical protein BDF22DRAFT_698310 [Syncephalis plumigaleata]
MHFNMNIISITAVAALLLASIESAESADPQVPKMYLGQLTGIKGAFDLPSLELVKVPDELGPVDYIEATWDNKPATLLCVDPSKPEGDTVRLFYEVSE